MLQRCLKCILKQNKNIYTLQKCNIAVADDPVTLGANASAAMVLNYLFRDIPASVPQGLMPLGRGEK